MALINFYFMQSGSLAPAGLVFLGGRIVGNPKNKKDYWVIGKKGLRQIIGREVRVAGFNRQIVELILSFA